MSFQIQLRRRLIKVLKDGLFKVKATKPAKEVVDDVPEEAMGGRPGGKGLNYLMGI